MIRQNVDQRCGGMCGLAGLRYSGFVQDGIETEPKSWR